MSEQQWVAVIDDDESIRTSIVRILRCMDIQASSFLSGEEFLRRPAGSEPACIVLDVHLGVGLNGFELHERLVSAGRAPAMILMTAHGDLEWPEDRKAGTTVDYLRKPFDPDDFIACVQRHLLADLSATSPPSAISESP